MRILPVLLLLSAVTGCQPDNQYEIRGTINDRFDGEWLYLVKFMQYKPDVDSALVSKGTFTFTGNVEYPELYVIHNRRDSILGFFGFYLEPAKMDIHIDVDDWSWGSQISGGQINEEYNSRIRNDENALVHLNTEIDEKKSLADSTELIVLDSIQTSEDDKFRNQNLDYIANYPDSPISPYLFARMFATIPFDKSEQILAGFSDQNKNTSICLSLQEKIDMMNEYRAGSIGE